MSPMRGCNGSWGRFTLQPIHPWTSSAADAPSGGGVCLETIIRGVTQKGVVLLLSLLPACYESNAFPSPCLSESCVCLGACWPWAEIMNQNEFSFSFSFKLQGSSAVIHQSQSGLAHIFLLENFWSNKLYNLRHSCLDTLWERQHSSHSLGCAR